MKNDINLLFEHKTKTYSKKKTAMILALVILFAVVLYAGITVPSGDLAALKEQSSELDSQLNMSSTAQQQLTDKAQQKKLTKAKLDEVTALENSKSDVTKYIEALERSLPTDANITSLAISEQTMGITGTAKDDVVIATFCLRLKEQNIFKEVFLSSSQISDDKLSTYFTIFVLLPDNLSTLEKIESIELKDNPTPSTAPSPSAVPSASPEVTQS